MLQSVRVRNSKLRKQHCEHYNAHFSCLKVCTLHAEAKVNMCPTRRIERTLCSSWMMNRKDHQVIQKSEVTDNINMLLNILQLFCKY